MLAILSALALAAPPSIDNRLLSGDKHKDDAAVVIGIEDYFALPDVPHAQTDARAFYDTLLYTRGVPLDRVALLNGASKEEISEAVAKAAKTVGKGGTLWVYYAGHGAASPVSNDRLLLGVDAKADEKSVESRSLSVGELGKLASKSAAAEIVVVLDACYGGQGRGGEELVPGKRFAVPTAALKADDRLTVWSAAEQSQLAGPMPKANHGAFTYFVVGALRGWADGEFDAKDGTVTLAEAQAYVSRGLVSVGIRNQTPSLDTRPGPQGWVLSRGENLEAGPVLDELIDGPKPKVLAPGGDVDLLTRYKAPLRAVSANWYVDANDQRVLPQDLVALASITPEGQVLKRKQGTYTALQIAFPVVGLAAAAPGIACLASGGWSSDGTDTTTSTASTTCKTLGIMGISVGIGGLIYPLVFEGQKQAIRGQMLGHANAALTPKP